MNRKQFGYSEDIVKYLQRNGTIPKGTFNIVRNSKGGKDYYYWYFNRSTGSNRLIHLCSVYENGEEENSFQHSIKVLKEKLSGVTRINSTKTFLNVIDDYILKLEKEGDENKRGTERAKKTIQDIKSHMNTFRDYVTENPISVREIQKDSFRVYFEEYVNYLINDYKKRDETYGLSDNSVRSNIIHIQQFLDELVEPRTGKRVIKYHPITSNFRKNLFRVRKSEQSIPDFYTVENYIKWVEELTKKVREVWREYLINPEEKPDKSTIVYFTSLLQLVYGFRIGELVFCYRNKNIKDELHRNKKSGYSYLYQTENSNTFVIYWKRKFGRVTVDYNVYSWRKSDSVELDEFYLKENHKKPTYSKNIVDVILTLYSDEKRVFPVDLGTLRKNYHNLVLDELGLIKTGVSKTHDLRDLMINFNLHTRGVTPFDLSQITRNSVSTIEKYYLHTSNEISVSISEKLSLKNRLKEVLELKFEGLSEENVSVDRH